jgi:hypothetical protein
MEPTTLTSSEAIKAVREGHHIARAGWNGKGMYVFRHDADGFKPVLVLHTARGEKQPGWVFSQDDLFADDWQIVS